MLIGVPYSGKSTWTENYFKSLSPGESENWRTYSTDWVIENICSLYNVEYGETFRLLYDFSEYMNNKWVSGDIKAKRNIVWDQTNLTKKSRKHKLKLFADYDERVAVYFIAPNKDVLSERINGRTKKVPMHVIEDMLKRIELPELEEGFTDILTVDTN